MCTLTCLNAATTAKRPQNRTEIDSRAAIALPCLRRQYTSCNAYKRLASCDTILGPFRASVQGSWVRLVKWDGRTFGGVLRLWDGRIQC